MKKPFIIISLFVLFLFIIFYIVFSLTNKQPSPQNVLPTPTPVLVQNNWRTYYKPKLDSYSAPFIQTLSVVSPIVISFDQQIDPSLVTYSITPQAGIYSVWSNENKTVDIRPKTFWQVNTPYTLFLRYKNNDQEVLLYEISFKAINTGSDN